MFRLYRDLIAIYWIGGIAAGFVCIGVAMLLSPLYLSAIPTYLSAILGYLVFISVLLIGVTYLNRKAVKRVNALHEDLLGQCRVREYLDIYHHLLTKRHARRKAVRNLLLSNMAIGYNAIGDDAEAIRLMRQVFLPPNPKKSRQQVDLLIYFNNMAKYYLDAGDIASARRALDDLKEAMSATPPYTSLLQYLVQLLEMRIRIAEGDFDGIRAALEIALSNENMLLRRINLCQDLARVNMHEGNTEKAKEYLIYIQQYGGDSRYVPWAAEELQRLDA